MFTPMPMSREEKFEKVQRLLTAHKKTKEVLGHEPVTWEVHPGTDIARHWTVITAAYVGLEQTLKYLIAEDNDLSVAKLIKLREGKERPYHTHNVSELFLKIEKPMQKVVRDFYRRFQSLHSYITVETVDKFLSVVSGTDGKGYERWRYTLVEDNELPRNSPEGLVAVWGVCVQLAEERVWETQRVRMPDEVLASEFCMQLDGLVLNVTCDRQNSGEPFRDIAGEIRGWLWRTGHPLNAFADVLWHASRYGEHRQGDVSEWLSDALTSWAGAVLNSPDVAGPTSLRAFVQRAQGRTPSGQGIRWNRDTNRFEDVPWSLKTRVETTVPPDAIVIDDSTGMRLWALRQAAKRSGYRVLENRAFDGPPNEDLWFRTLELQSEEDSDGKTILTIWQQPPKDIDPFYIVEQWPREAIDEHVRRWIEVEGTMPGPSATWGA